jgi:hypothetical protein
MIQNDQASYHSQSLQCNEPTNLLQVQNKIGPSYSIVHARGQ